MLLRLPRRCHKKLLCIQTTNLLLRAAWRSKIVINILNPSSPGDSTTRRVLVQVKNIKHGFLATTLDACHSTHSSTWGSLKMHADSISTRQSALWLHLQKRSGYPLAAAGSLSARRTHRAEDALSKFRLPSSVKRRHARLRHPET